MTDAEIAKAKAHFEYGIKADIFSEPVLSYAKTVIEAFDLIPRQNAEIERLTINMNAFGLGMIREKERADTARAEAIKEFAERLKSRLITVTYMNFDDTIDNLVKEMAGDTE